MATPSPERWRQVSELFEQALSQPPTRREEYLRERRVDPRILAEVRSLLESAEREDDFLTELPASVQTFRARQAELLATPPGAAPAETLRPSPIGGGSRAGGGPDRQPSPAAGGEARGGEARGGEARGGDQAPAAAKGAREVGVGAGGADPLIGERISGCTIVARIAAGGMGVLYEAQQENPRRTVAVKLIRPDMVSPETLARFRRESELLGRLQHPGIAAVFEAGSFVAPGDPADAGRPYCVMELIDGVPITEFAERRRASVPTLLELLAQVCDAVDHAHARGVVHRDLKPSNILVTPDGQPKVVDFGIARALGPGPATGLPAGAAQERAGASSGTLRTNLGDIVGTLGYMSPEQLEGRTADVDARSDVYSLGVLAYELLSGRPPFDLRGLGIAESLRRLSEDSPTSLGALRRNLRGDVSVVVATAMARDSARRYPTAAALARDLRRILDSRPVSAKPPSATYRLRKFVSRHRRATASGVVVAVLLVAAAGVATLGWRRASRESGKTQQVNDVLRGVLGWFDPGELGSSDVSLRRAVDEASRRVASELADQPGLASELHTILGQRYAALGAHREALAEHQRALAGHAASGSQDRLLRAELLSDVGSELVELGEAPLGVARHAEALAIREELLADDDLAIAESLHNLSVAHRAAGELERALACVQRAVAIVRSHQPQRVAELSWSLAHLGTILLDLGRVEDAVAATQEAVALREQIKPDDLQKAKLLHRFASVLAHDPRRRADSAEMLRQSIAIRRALLPADRPELHQSRIELALLLIDLGEHPEATALLEESLTALARRGPIAPAQELDVLEPLRVCRAALGDADAVAALDRRIEALRGGG